MDIILIFVYDLHNKLILIYNKEYVNLVVMVEIPLFI